MSGSSDSGAVNARIAGLTPAKRALLERLAAEKARSAPPKRPERSTEAGPSRPLSFAQQRLWILDQLEPGDAAYSRPVGFRLIGTLDRGALSRTLDDIVGRHEVLRARFPVDADGQPGQLISAPEPIELTLVDIGEEPQDHRESRACVLAQEEAERPFDLSAGPLFRATLYRLADDDHVLLIVFHHIVFDAWSAEVLQRELAVLYDAHAAGEPVPLDDLPIQYGDFAAFERARLAQGELDAGLGYWRRRLDPPAPHLGLPTDRSLPAVRSSRGATCKTVLPAPLIDSLKSLARRHDTTLFTVMLAAWQTLLHRISGEVDIAVGTPVAGRATLDTESLIGCFVNTLVMRSDLAADPPFADLLARVHDDVRAALQHEDVPFDRVVAAVAPPRESARTPPFRVFFNMHSVPRMRYAPVGLTMTPFEVETDTAKFDLGLELAEVADGMVTAVSFTHDLFDESTIDVVITAWEGLLDAIVADPGLRLSELPAPVFTTPEPQAAPEARVESGPSQSAAVSDQERESTAQALSVLFSAVLGRDDVDHHADFFDLGGHSLLAIRVVARARAAFAVELPPRAVFDAPTPALLAERVLSAPRARRRADPVDASSDLHAPVASGQERLWLASQIETQSAQYNVVSARRLRGSVDTDALERALEALLTRHDALRTNIAGGEDGPELVVGESGFVRLSSHDVSAAPPERREADARRILAEHAREPFDLARDVLMRAAIVRLDENDHILCMITHHVASDGWSVDILWRELFVIYDAGVDGAIAALPQLPLRYTDWARLERDRAQDTTASPNVEMWRRRLDGTQPLELPTDRPRPPVQSHRGAIETFAFAGSLGSALLDVGRGEGATFFISLLAAWAALLHRLSGQTDFAVGSVIAGRTDYATEGLVGLFANTVALRVNLDGDPTFRELIARTRACVLDAYSEPDVPFQRLVEELRLPRDPSRSPVFQTMVVEQVAARRTFEANGLTATPIDIDPGTAQFDLTLFASSDESGVTGRLEYASDLFDPATARRIIAYLEMLIDNATSDPDRPLSQLTIIPDEERHQVLVGWNDTHADYPATTIHDAFAEQAARTPDAIALVQGDRQCLYGELETRANRLAHLIRAAGVTTGAPVGVFLERSIEATVAFLAVLKAGCPVLALDPSYPPDRIAFMLDDAAAQLVLTESRLAAQLPAGTAAVVMLDAVDAGPAGHRGDDFGPGTGPDDAAYIIYTSGSTGTPKGVVGLHRGTINRISWMNDAYPFVAGEIACQKTALGFVDSIAEIFGPILCGVPSVIVPDDVAKDPWALTRTLSEHRVTRIVLVPGMLKALLALREELREELPRLTLWVTSGEALAVDVAREFATLMPHARLVNLYGSSEVAGDATSYEVPALITDLRAVPIGRPIDNTGVYLLDRHRMPVPIGVAGEICIGGDGLARGYLGRPELTDERFVPNPFGHSAAPRLYRTGDLGRYRANGDIEYLGRSDQQVKIRGVRIEFGEVEAALEMHPGVRAAAVAARQDASGDDALVGYLVAADDTLPSQAELRVHLSRRLIPQMIPTTFVPVDTLPMTPSGKLDRRALPTEPHHAGRDVVAADTSAPSATESSLILLWKEVLGLAHVGVDDDFFDIGGHSMLAVRLFARIHETFGTELPVSVFFESPTVASLAHILDGGRIPNADPTVVTLQPLGAEPPLFLAPGIGNEVVAFLRLARRMAPHRKVYGLTEDFAAGARPVDELADEFAAKVRRLCVPGRPCHLGGYSSGAAVVIEVARRLRAQGIPVGVVAIFDHPNPASGYASRLPWRPRQMVRFAKNGVFWLRQPGHADLRYLLSGVRRKARYFVKILARRLAPFGVPRPRFELADFLDAAVYPDRWREQMSASLQARLGFAPAPYAGRLTLFRAHVQPLLCSFDDKLGWGDVAVGGLEIHNVPGNHISMLQAADVGALAAGLLGCMDRADGGTASGSDHMSGVAAV